MRKPSGGRWAVVLGLVSALVSACDSSAGSDPQGAAGTAGDSAELGGSAGDSAELGGSGAQLGGSGGRTSASGGSGGKVTIGQGGSATANGGTHAGGSGGSGGSIGTENIFLDQIIVGQGGGPQKCLPRSLPTGLPGSANDGQATTCMIIELKPGSCDCSQTARAALPKSILNAAQTQLKASGACGGASGTSCDTFCGCELAQAPGTASDHSSALYACENELTPSASVNGFCVVDQLRTDASGAPAPLGNPAIVSECPANQKRLLRFVGAGAPASGASLFLGCTSASL